MSKFKFCGKVSILHLNTRKEGHDEEKELAVDVKFTCRVGSDALAFFDDHLADFLYLDSGAVRSLQLGPITFKHELENYELTVAGSTFNGSKVKKFIIEPADGWQVDLTFQVSFQPTGGEVAVLAEYLQEELEISLYPENGELELGQAA